MDCTWQLESLSVSGLNLECFRRIETLGLKDQEDILGSKTQLQRGIHSTARTNGLVWVSTNGSEHAISYKTSFAAFGVTTYMVDS